MLMILHLMGMGIAVDVEDRVIGVDECGTLSWVELSLLIFISWYFNMSKIEGVLHEINQPNSNFTRGHPIVLVYISSLFSCVDDFDFSYRWSLPSFSLDLHQIRLLMWHRDFFLAVEAYFFAVLP